MVGNRNCLLHLKFKIALKAKGNACHQHRGAQEQTDSQSGNCKPLRLPRGRIRGQGGVEALVPLFSVGQSIHNSLQRAASQHKTQKRYK